ncbi:MAG: hypothetical protein EOL97_07070 [Spirochaetia bacterium]|nr:hypothetical protein [Spirochaetia bacterium]
MRANTSLTSVLISVLFGMMALMLAFNSYSGIITYNDGTVGSDITDFSQDMLNASYSFNETTGEFTQAADNPEESNIFTKFADFGDNVISYVTIGWNAIDTFGQMGDNFRNGINAIGNNVTWLDATLFATMTAAIVVWIAFAIINAKKSTGGIS